MNLDRRTLLTGAAAVAALAHAAPGFAQARPPAALTLTNVAARDGVDLSGAWHWSVDPYRDGMAGFHGAQAGFGHRRYDDHDVDAVTRANPNALIEYDMQRSPLTQLPAAWLAHDPTLRYFVGLMWYQRAFDLPALGRRRAFVHVGAANYKTQVFVNGRLLGAHEGGFTPFAFEIPRDLLRAGSNQITLGVDSEPTWDSVPPPVTDWENYGGVTREVRIVLTPETFVDDAFIRLTRDGQRIAATVKLDGPNRGARPVSLRIPGLRLTMSGRTAADGVAEFSTLAPARLNRWSPEAPTLYDVRIEAAGDALAERIGFRTIEVRGEDILLNGAPIFLRGICMHEEEFGEHPGRIINDANARALLGTIKQGLNGNFVRLAHYPHSEVTTRLADEMGLLVWSEIPVYWRINWTNADTLQVARNMLAENIRRDRNRAAIILWSVANETPLSDPRNAFLETLTRDVRALDDTRLVTAALLTDRETRNGRPVMVLNDPLAAHLDVLGVNTYNGWYSDDALSALPNIGWESRYGKPMIFSEFGADAQFGFHDPELRRKFSEEFQAEYYRQTLAMSERVSFLRGLAPWILKDFRSPRRQHPIYQEGWNRKGVVSPTGDRKQAFSILAAHYQRLSAR